MRIAITGEMGFIAQNLIKTITASENTFVSLIGSKNICQNNTKTSEPCVYSNTVEDWASALSDNEIDILIHNAAVVGTDVVALNAEHSSLTNVMGSHTVARAANAADVAICYMGTTVIYNTPLYQDTVITEQSCLNPTTLYGIQKLAGEQVIKATANKWMVVRPLFAYGGEGDMNSLIAKSLYAHKNNIKSLDMFLDPKKIKDYMHVSDYCNAVLTACEKELWFDDYNVASENPHNTREIVQIMSEIDNYDFEQIINWHPKTDYLGNHILSSLKFRLASGWQPKINLFDGISDSLFTIQKCDKEYNPLKYLDEAKERGVNLADFY
jgi:dTDP-glucose 4,6-dehydratase